MMPYVLAILLASATTSATPAFEVRTTDGQSISGVPVELGAERLTLAGNGDRASIEVARLLTVVAQKTRAARRARFRLWSS